MKNVFTINEMAEKTGVHPQTLRNWEKDGLIRTVEKVGNKRLFTEQNMQDIQKIKELKSSGYQLKGIKKIIQEGEKSIMPAKIEKSKKSLQRPANRIKTNVPKINYAEKSITELTDIAKLQGLKYFRQMNKQELVEALSNPKNANAMIEQAKMRTKERYGGKVYGASKTMVSNTEKKFDFTEKNIRTILNMNKKGMSVKEILNKMNSL